MIGVDPEPKPIVELTESPQELYATTVALTVVPHGRLNGELLNVATGIEQDLVEITDAEPPLQKVYD